MFVCTVILLRHLICCDVLVRSVLFLVFTCLFALMCCVFACMYCFVLVCSSAMSFVLCLFTPLCCVTCVVDGSALICCVGLDCSGVAWCVCSGLLCCLFFIMQCMSVFSLFLSQGVSYRYQLHPLRKRQSEREGGMGQNEWEGIGQRMHRRENERERGKTADRQREIGGERFRL